MSSIDPNDTPIFRDSRHIPDHYWQELQAMDPQDVSQRAMVPFQSGTGYLIPFWDRIYFCHPETQRIWRKDDPEKNMSFQEYLVLLMYLLKSVLSLINKRVNCILTFLLFDNFIPALIKASFISSGALIIAHS